MRESVNFFIADVKTWQLWQIDSVWNKIKDVFDSKQQNIVGFCFDFV